MSNIFNTVRMFPNVHEFLPSNQVFFDGNQIIIYSNIFAV